MKNLPANVETYLRTADPPLVLIYTLDVGVPSGRSRKKRLETMRAASQRLADQCLSVARQSTDEAPERVNVLDLGCLIVQGSPDLLRAIAQCEAVIGVIPNDSWVEALDSSDADS